MPTRLSADALRRCDASRPVTTLVGTAFGTSWRVRAAMAADAGPLRHAIEARLAAIADEMSQWLPASLLSRFNRAPAGSWVTLPPDFAAVMAAALSIAGRSGGLFDPTLGRAAALLGFGAERPSESPSAAAFAAAHAAAGWRKLAFDPGGRRLRQPGGLWLDLSGIAKGYAVDAVADLLRDRGLEDALVEIGGELAGRGLRPDAQPWWVDLEAPPGGPLPPLRIGLHDLAVATSGDYRRGAHTLDPATGQACGPRLASVSVIHREAMHADAWATALTVAGLEAGLALARQAELPARFVVREEAGLSEVISPALAEMLEE